MSSNDHDKQRAIKKFKRFAFWYIIVSLPICLAIMFWPMADNVTLHGHIAHYLAIPLAFISGLFFMGIIFFSSHGGGDEQPNFVEMMKRQEAERQSREENP